MTDNKLLPQETILVVEDDTGIRESLQDILELKGYKVNTAINGREGLIAIIKKNPTLVICDVNMPKMSGFELLKTLNDSMKKEIVPPFLFLTARVESSDIRKGLDLGADDYLTKPFNHIDLLKTVKAKIEKRRQIQSMAITEEQDRISNELHDSIQQILVAAQMGFNSVEKNIDLLDKKSQNTFKRSQSLLLEASEDLRNVSHDISNIKGLDLSERVEDLLIQLKEAGEIDTHFNYKVNREFEINEKIELLRIIQEAVNNVVKYANARNLSVLINADDEGGKLLINDDGSGFDLENIEKGKGMENMEKRSQNIGAGFKIESKPNKGTIVTITW